jgi:hypothetical protein
MGMMGGMGAMGGAGGQGGDQERSNPYRIDGGIFDSAGGSRISGSLGEDDDSDWIRFGR